MQKFKKILPVGLILLLSNIKAQGIFSNPDSLYKVGNYEMSKIGYDYKLFNLNQSDTAYSDSLAKYNYKLYEINFRLKKYDAAYKNICQLTENEFGGKNEFLYKKALCLYLSKEFAACEIEIKQSIAKDSMLLDSKIATILALSLNELEKWDESRKILKKSFVQKYSEKGDRLSFIDSIYTVNKPRFKKEKKAEILNLFIPGAGYWYIHRRKDAITTASLQLLSLSITGYMIYQKLYLTSGLIGLGLYNKFRIASSERVINLTRKYNENNKYIYNQKLRYDILGVIK